MMKKSIYFVLRGCVMAGLASAFAANATQTVQPVKDVAGTAFSGSGAAWTGTAGLGTVVTVIGRYTAAGNESGLGVKVVYDEAKFTGVSVTALNTKCMVAPPQIQPGGIATKAVMGWIDSSVRDAAGNVGWPYLADPATSAGPPPTSPCLSPNTPANDTTATAGPSVNLFQFTGTLAAGVGVGGTATVAFVSDGNYSYAGTTPGMQDQLLTITAAAAPACSLDVDGSGNVQALVDGVLIVRNMLGLTGASLTGSLAFPASATRTTPAAIATFLAGQNYDSDGSSSQQALVDGVILVRLMLNLPDANLLTGVSFPPSATVTTAAAIRAGVNSRCGTSF